MSGNSGYNSFSILQIARVLSHPSIRCSKNSLRTMLPHSVCSEQLTSHQRSRWPKELPSARSEGAAFTRLKAHSGSHEQQVTGNPRSSPVERISEMLPLHIELKDGPLAVCGGVVTAAVLLQEGVEAVLRRVFLTAHEHHWGGGGGRSTERSEHVSAGQSQVASSSWQLVTQSWV